MSIDPEKWAKELNAITRGYGNNPDALDAAAVKYRALALEALRNTDIKKAQRWSVHKAFANLASIRLRRQNGDDQAGN